MKRGRKTPNKIYTAESSIRTFSIKHYVEQIKGYSEGCNENELIETYLQNVENIDNSRITVIAILHDKDYVEKSDFWQPSAEKFHIHVWGIVKDSSPTKLRVVFNMLGIDGSRPEDAEMWKHHGAEPIASSFEECALYATHETIQAVKDGKTKYNLSDIHTNLDMNELLKLRGCAEENKNGKQLSKDIELAKIDAEAYSRGYNLQDFNEWFYELPFLVNSNSNLERVCRNSYNRGIQKLAEDSPNLVRVCVFIQGEGNVGKTYAAHSALADKKILDIDGGGSGKFDRLLPTTEAIVIDDQVCPNLLNMTDNRICQAYRRQNNNPYWCGKYFVVTSNLSFRDWVESCGLKTTDSNCNDTSNYKALLTRFYVCKVSKVDGVNRLLCISQSTRGTIAEQNERNAEFIKFKEKFNLTISQYYPVNDLSVLNVTDWLPCEETTPFDILDGTPLEPSSNAKIISTESCLIRYENSEPKIYKQALKWTRERYAELGLQINIPQFKESLLRRCAQLDMKSQIDTHRQIKLGSQPNRAI